MNMADFFYVPIICAVLLITIVVMLGMIIGGINKINRILPEIRDRLPMK